jgi:hypothetical protein
MDEIDDPSTTEIVRRADGVNARTFGRRAFLAGTAGAIAGATLLSGSAQAVEPGASFFEVVEQRRLCDTRNRPGASAGYGYRRLGDRWIRVGVTNQAGVPADAVAAVLSVTAVSTGAGANFVTVFPSGERVPETSSLNMSPSDGAVANLVTIKLGAGAVDLTTYVSCDLIVDLIGVYRPTTTAVSSGRLVAFSSAARTLDTRSGPQTCRRFDLAGQPQWPRSPRRDGGRRHAHGRHRRCRRLRHRLPARQHRARHVEPERRCG